MIQPHQYLKDIYQMSEKEKEALAKRVYSIGVDDNSLDYDLQTLSALSRAHGFISVAHQLDSDRIGREIQGFVKIMKEILPTLPPTLHFEASQKSPGGGVGYNSHAESVQQINNNVQKNADSEKKSQKGVQSAKNDASKGGDRPNHFDSWFDQMSDGLQKKIATLSDLHTKKKYYRGLVEQLADNPNHSKQDMALAATLTVNYENKIKAIYDQAQIEWDELQGRSVSDEVKRIALQDEEKADKEIRKAERSEEPNSQETEASSNQEVEQSSSQDIDTSRMTDDELKALTVAEIQASDMPDGPKTYYINKRIDLARGYLKKMTPGSTTDEQKQKALGYAKELADAGKALSPKAKENLAACGIEMNN